MRERAVILAGGLGSRLRPYTVVLPKPLMPIGDFSILEVIIRQLRRSHIDHVTLAVSHQANIIQAVFGDGAQFGLRIDYSLETEPLSTIAPLLLINDLPETFLLMNGDVLTDLDFAAFLANHRDSGCTFTVSAARRTEHIDYGVLHVNNGDRLFGFEEKPKVDYLVSMGVYGVNREALNELPKGQRFGFDDLMRKLIDDGSPVGVRIHEGYWRDIGRPDDYLLAIDEFGADPSRFLGP
jgi:NDP-sugar pyrophosphorylase family protein